MTPRISICIPTYNRPDGLRNTIAAMLRQTMDDWELIVGDDASQDPIGGIVQEFADPRIRCHRNVVNLGIYANWNHLLSMVRGEYVCIYHDHDFYLPTILERSCEILDRHPTVSFVHTAMVLIDRVGTPLDVMIQPFGKITAGSKFQAMLLQQGCFVTAATAMVRRTAYNVAGQYHPEIGRSHV
jgi:glycosyltransferase involved in cell wall biosynthesis